MTRGGVTAEEFRRLALALEGAVEGEHMDHPDFRANGRIFATLLPATAKRTGAWGMVKLPADEQADYLDGAPDAFEPASGVWGRQGSTLVRLDAVTKARVSSALEAAWRHAVAQPPGRSRKKKR